MGVVSYKNLDTHWPLITSFNGLLSDHTQQPHLLATHTLITPTSHNFQPYISFTVQKFSQKRNVRLKIVASGCDQWVWPVGVVVGCGH